MVGGQGVLWGGPGRMVEETAAFCASSVFQLSHEKYKPFVFAAETLSDLSM